MSVFSKLFLYKLTHRVARCGVATRDLIKSANLALARPSSEYELISSSKVVLLMCHMAFLKWQGRSDSIQQSPMHLRWLPRAACIREFRLLLAHLTIRHFGPLSFQLIRHPMPEFSFRHVRHLDTAVPKNPMLDCVKNRGSVNL